MHGSKLSWRQPRKDVFSRVSYLLCLLLFFLPSHLVFSLSADGLALLEIKKAIKSDPFRILSSWNENDPEPCAWNGVLCDVKSRRVVSLNLTGNPFYGASGASFNFSNGFCKLFSSLPSEQVQRSGTQSFPWRDLSSEMPMDSSSSLLCLRNGTVLGSSSAYKGNDRIPCTLAGPLSSAIGNLSELQTLALSFLGFYGEIPKEIGALGSLQVLDLSGNAFSGGIPAEIGWLSQLRIFNLAYNYLNGEIPSDLSSCNSIQVFNLAGNLLTGNIPSFLGDMPDLWLLSLSFNQLDGTIPPELLNSCQNLKHLHVAGNFLTGTIPPELGNCSQLQSLMLFSNFLSGPIPVQLGRLSKLQSLDVSRNSLGDEIPSELGNCSQLYLLILTNVLAIEPCINCTAIDHLNGYTNKDKDEFNYFAGELPNSILRLPRIRILWAPKAGLNGALPLDWGECRTLEVLNLGGNMFTGDITGRLGSCRSLIYLDLSSNELQGTVQDLPVTCMVVFNVSGNSLSGNVSVRHNDNCHYAHLLSPRSSFSALPIWVDDSMFLSLDTVSSYFFTLYCGSVSSSLPPWFATQGMPVVHDFRKNAFTGAVPGPLAGSSLMDKFPAYGLFLSSNKLTGAIPSMLFNSCDTFQVFMVSLSWNLLSETLPFQEMAHCKSLRYFEAAANNLTGTILLELEFRSLVHLDLGMNNLSGKIPLRAEGFPELEYLVLAHNNLEGTIPAELGDLSSLILLDLSGNQILGEIPAHFANLKHLKFLSLNNNSLSGSIPKSFSNLTSLVMVNLAFNNFSGTIPKIGNLACSDALFAGNKYLMPCSSTSPASSPKQPDIPFSHAVAPTGNVGHEGHRSNSFFVAMVVVGVFIVVMVVGVSLYFQLTKKQMPDHTGFYPREKVVVTFGSSSNHLTYENIVRATGNFSVDNLIGTGGFGATYRAEIMPGVLVAVKKLSLGRFQGVQQFDAEIHTLGRIRHPNLVTLMGYHASESEMFLIYNYLPRGNLESLIHNSEPEAVSWRIRHKISLDVAQALAYLHECTPKVLHRDIKPSNILLDNSLNAYLSDFGLARLLAASETHATTDVAGTFGYVAPEYAMTCRVSDKADVYSYGVVFLELLSGKRALDPSFSQYGDGFSIVAWAHQLLDRGQEKEVFAPGLWEQGPQSELIAALELAVMCTVDSLKLRPSMKGVVTCLRSLRLLPVS